jgi:hypothetical protein
MKLNYAARTMLSIFSFNVCWWASALGVSHGQPWVGPALLPIFVAAHLYFSPVSKGDAVFLALMGIIGFVIDTVLIRLELFTLIPAAVYAPMWLVAMWILMGQTYESMLMMRRSKFLLCASGAFSGPLTYYCFEALNILHYARPLWLSLAAHAVFWAAITPALFKVRDWSLHIMGVTPSVLVQPLAALEPEPALLREDPRGLDFQSAVPSDPDKH